jgi:beta-glucuronidase
MKKEKINITDTIKNIFKDSDKKRIVKTVGSGKVKLAQYGDGRWELLLDDKPYMVKGVTYAPTPIGESPDEGNLANWMVRDANNNGKIDGPYDSYIDTDNNKNPVGDFQLMKDMGVNTIRLYHQPLELNKELLRKLYHEYGIRVVVGDFLGKYAIGSKASWTEGTDYSNPVHQENMLKSVLKMVEDHKDEPYVLFWLIGNENVFGVACNADKEPDSFFKFANKVAQEIKKIDKNHPVAISNGDVLFLDRFAKFAPDVDIFGVNAYRGEFGFGSLWEAVSEFADKPVLVTEFGCPAYVKGVPQDEAEARQEEYHRGNWEDIDYNSKDGFKNAIGGFIFEFLDEWWKAYEPSRHDTKGLATGPFPDGFYYEEWFGLCGQGDGNDSPFLRHLRKSYFYYQKEWTGKEADKIF